MTKAVKFKALKTWLSWSYAEPCGRPRRQKVMTAGEALYRIKKAARGGKTYSEL